MITFRIRLAQIKPKHTFKSDSINKTNTEGFGHTLENQVIFNIGEGGADRGKGVLQIKEM